MVNEGMDAKPEIVVAGYVSGSAGKKELDESIKEAWKNILADPTEREKVASLLEVQADKLDPEVVPFTATQADSGSALAEVLVVVATTFGLAVIQGAGEAFGAAAARRCQKLWNDYMSDRVNPPGSGKLGEPKE